MPILLKALNWGMCHPVIMIALLSTERAQQEGLVWDFNPNLLFDVPKAFKWPFFARLYWDGALVRRG